MARTTIDIDDPILRDLKRLQRRAKKSLGRLVSDLLAQALAAEDRRTVVEPALQWSSQAMGARVDLSDREAVYAVLDRESDNGEGPV